MTRPRLRIDPALALRTLTAAVLGVVHAAAFSPPLDVWWLQIIALAGLFLLIEAPGGPVGSLRRPQLLTPVLAFGLGWFTSGVGWLYTSMHVYGGMPAALAGAAVLLFALYLSLFPLAAAWAARHWVPRGSGRGHGHAAGLPWALSIAAFWGASELLRGWLFTGFPWLSIGYAQVDGPFAGFAPWLGVYGVGTLTALVAALAATVLLSWRQARRTSWCAIGLFALLVLAGALLASHEPTRPGGEPVTVRLAQGNVPQQMKFDRQRALDAMLDYTAMVESADAQLVVLPETAWTVPWSGTPADIAARLGEHSRDRQAAIAIGMPLQSAPGPHGSSRYTNSVALLHEGALASRYDKRHLVPFGEFIPRGFGWFVQLMQIPLGEFGRGAPAQPPFEVGGQRFAFNICYEDLFGEELLESIRDGGASVLVNVSNIAWFGDSRALPQHLAIARMRTLETGRPMLRATNTGVTASIDHRGRVLARLPHYQRDVLDVSVQGTTGLTAYVRHGLLLPLALLAALLLAARVLVRRGGARNR